MGVIEVGRSKLGLSYLNSESKTFDMGCALLEEIMLHDDFCQVDLESYHGRVGLTTVSIRPGDLHRTDSGD